MPRQRPAADNLAVIAEVVTAHLDFLKQRPLAEIPGAIGLAPAHIAQRAVVGQIFGRMRSTVARQVVGAGAGNAMVIGYHRQGHQAGVSRHAKAQGDVDRVAKQVGIAVIEQQLQTDGGVLQLELIQPAQQHIATKVRGRGQLQ